MTAPLLNKEATATTTSVPLATSGSSSSSSESTNVRVVGRIRPLAAYELAKNCQAVVTTLPSDESATGAPEVLHVEATENNGENQSRWFELHAVFGMDSTQLDVYQRSGAQQAVCHDLFRGLNCTILAYGQTGAGKTYTMGTATPVEGGEQQEKDGGGDHGIIPRACHDLFDKIQTYCHGNATVESSY